MHGTDQLPLRSGCDVPDNSTLEGSAPSTHANDYHAGSQLISPTQQSTRQRNVDSILTEDFGWFPLNR